MKVLQVIFVSLCIVLFVSPVANAACTINDNNGTKFLDSDCDGIVDNDVDGTPVDICLYAKNGNCEADPINCDVNKDGKVTELEARAGDQMDWNHNGAGDACEDTDGDGVLDYLDNCLTKLNPAQNIDDCADYDGDKIDDTNDNCPENYNTRQIDTDEDNVGDVCDSCALDYNPNQNVTNCKTASGVVGVNPDIVNPEGGTTPGGEGGVNYVMYNREMGSGGCSLITVPRKKR